VAGKGSQLFISGVEKTDNGTFRCQFVSLLSAYLTVRLFVQGLQNQFLYYISNWVLINSVL
jgi:hypothetical protein